jgi:hypothetical protein
MRIRRLTIKNFLNFQASAHQIRVHPAPSVKRLEVPAKDDAIESRKRASDERRVTGYEGLHGVLSGCGGASRTPPYSEERRLVNTRPLGCGRQPAL